MNPDNDNESIFLFWTMVALMLFAGVFFAVMK